MILSFYWDHQIVGWNYFWREILIFLQLNLNKISTMLQWWNECFVNTCVSYVQSHDNIIALKEKATSEFILTYCGEHGRALFAFRLNKHYQDMADGSVCSLFFCIQSALGKMLITTQQSQFLPLKVQK